MPLTPEQQRTIQAALNSKITQPCPGCGNRNWQMSDGYVLLTLSYWAGAITFANPALPCVALICNICGNTQLYNAFMLGVADQFGIKGTPTQGGQNG